MPNPAIPSVTNVILAGLGGQGVLTASDVLAETAFLAGHDVKKAEIHGMSQRGGSVTSDVRFGVRVYSPMVPAGEADFLVVLAEEEVPHNRAALRAGGVLLEPALLQGLELPHARTANIALLGLLSQHLDFPETLWEQALERHLPERLREGNHRAFDLGRRWPAGGPS
jgi:indolepyruvate ferredoxin oxidoreductase beta subunit